MNDRLDQLSPVKRAAYQRLRDRERARVTLRAGDGRCGLVLVHPVGGSLGCYLELLARLPDELPVVGFAADRLTFDVGIPELAREYLAAMGHPVIPGGRRLASRSSSRADPAVIPRRRWCYAGWSFGGAVAFEMARLAGPDSVAVLLDTDRPVEADGSPALSDTTIRQFFVDDLARLDGDAATVEAELGDRLEVYVAYTRALAFYEPGNHSGPTYVVRAGRPPGVPIPWHEHCADLTVCDVPEADHYTLLTTPCLDTPLKVIVEALDRLRHQGGTRQNGE